MSDRAATEGLFNNLFQVYRKECRPLYTDNWDNFSVSVQEKYNFFCGLHLLTSMADAVASSFKKFEETHLDGKKVGAAVEGGITVF